VSGGGIWVPCNEQMEKLGCADSFAEAKGYVELLTEGEVEPRRLDAYLKRATEMVHYMAERFSVRFKAISIYPDYFPHLPGGKPGYRTMEPEDFDAARLGEEFDKQREPYPGTLMMGRIAMNQVEAHAMLCRTRGWVLLFLKLALRYFMDFRWRRKSRRDRRQVLGQGMVAALRYAMLREGVPLWLNTGLEELISEDGRVVGARVQRDGKTLHIRARRGVILACGGFESNQAMREQYLPAPTDKSWSIAPGINLGDGIQAGQALGAGTRFMDLTWGTPSVVVPGAGWASGLFVERAFPHGIMVNGKGQRFCNEAGPYTEVVYSIYRDHQKTGCSVPCWFICDADYRKKYPFGPIMPPALQPDSKIPAEWEGQVYFKADSLAEMADRLGIDAAGLQATVDRYNSQCVSGKDEDFGKGENCFDTYYGDHTVKPNPCMGPLAKPPFYALKVLPGELGTKG
ncbi:MAG: FAD-binding protein, partial [Alphaproteobacteria bacterium]|nr:FAD-binding protein [Alphaproteobacteria bacterium]